MKIKAKGKCVKCSDTFGPEKGESHLIECALQSFHPSQKLTGGYLIRVAAAGRSNIYIGCLLLFQKMSHSNFSMNF